MLDNLINLVKQYAGDEVNNNPAIPEDKKGAVVEETSNSITGSLQNMASGGGLNDLLAMFTKQGPSPAGNVSQQISGDVVSNLTNKVGLDANTANGFAGGLIPKILGSLVNKTNDPGDNSFNLESIFSQLTGGKTSGADLSGMLGKLKSGLDRDGDGDVDLQDAMKLFGK
ncbi:MAG: DUF937 domain-containing protein [Chitinophagaceae bacterium]|nr:MAG: DUF937 domain-containing protein [Chitinophagaceae bacterium]